VNDDYVWDALLRRLGTTSLLAREDAEAIRRLPVTLRSFQADQVIVRDGDRPSECCLVIEGFCHRSKTIADGGRQILSIHIPGEIPDLQSLHLVVMDHDLTTMSECRLAFISHVALREMLRSRPSLAGLFWRDTLIDAAMFRDWIVNVGQRPAVSRVAHMLVEIRERLRAIGRTSGPSYALPMTQERIAEAMGISPVHANRVIRSLREDGILDLNRGQVTVLDERRLQDLADFDPRYLHQSPAK
jgi:CRP-like cAMP-binding protein